MKAEPAGDLLIRARAAFEDVTADPRRGRVVADEVAAQARLVEDHEASVVALRAAGWAARELYEHDVARQRLDDAVAIARAHGLTDRLCEVLITRSAMFLELGHPRRARNDLDEARAIARGTVRGEVAFAHGLLEDKVGNFAAAIAAYRRALVILRHDRRDVRAKAMNNLALSLARVGRYAEAEHLLDQAVELTGTFSPALTGIVLESRADVAIASGQHVEALRRYDRAEQALTSIGVQLVDLYLGKAKALLSLRLLDEAASAAAAAVAQVEDRRGGSLMLAEALLPQARIALISGRLDDAHQHATRAESLFRRQRRAGWRATATLLRLSAQVARDAPTSDLLLQLSRLERTMRRSGIVAGAVDAGLLVGDVARALGRRRKALAAYDRVAEVASSQPVLVRMQGRLAAAQAAELRGDTRRLGAVCRLGLDELAAYRATFASAELRARAAAHGTKLAAVGLRASLRTSRAEQTWTWLERSRSVAFLGGVPSSDAALRPLLAQLRALESELVDVPVDMPTRAAHLRRITRLEQQVRNTSWMRSAQSHDWTAPSVRTLRQLRADLGDRLLLQYGVLDGRLCAVSVTSDRLRRVELGRLDDAVASGRQLGFALRRLVQRGGSRSGRDAAFVAARHELAQLAHGLLDPFGDAIDSGAEIVVAPVGELIGIPWGSLEPIADRPVRIVPSAVSWWLSQRAVRRSDRVVLVAGPDLSAADDEVREITDLHADAVRLRATDATCDAVRVAASGAGLVHVAAHGRLRSDSPTFSSVQLADGPLTVHDLDGLPAPAHHWVIAACDLGNPGAVAGPALEGVLATLLSRGSGAVIAATVSIPDLDTRHMVVELHRCLAGGASMAESLRRARTAVDPSSPAGFVAGTAFSCYGGG
jgi:tetratricopeptide (TPR) repeat protein